METLTADRLQQRLPLPELSKRQKIAFEKLMQGSKLPDGSMGPEIVKKVSLRGLQPTMTNVELDFLRLCLVLDGAERPSAS
jgi:hypothetical protein